MVGCTSCETWCIYGAISFPDHDYVKNLIKEKGLLKVAKKELEQKYAKKECCGGQLK
jgi:Fe-S-cluster-containing dehydrogenase component